MCVKGKFWEMTKVGYMIYESQKWRDGGKKKAI
jgi:hypothetical protein